MPLDIIFDKTEEYIRKYDKTRYLALLYSLKEYEKIIDRVK